MAPGFRPVCQEAVLGVGRFAKEDPKNARVPARADGIFFCEIWLGEVVGWEFEIATFLRQWRSQTPAM